jgi:RNA polymerase sigma factor (sigma-70 family)
MILYSDKAILQGLKKKQERYIRYLYKEFSPMINNFVIHNSGTYEDAEDVFQDALVLLYKRICTGNVCLNCSLKTYFYAICRNIWMKRLSRKQKILYQDHMEVHEDPTGYSTGEYEFREDNLEMVRLFHRHFLLIPEDCQKVLMLFLEKVPLKTIAGVMGFKSVGYAKARKYMCKNMLRKRILKDPSCKIFLNDD